MTESTRQGVDASALYDVSTWSDIERVHKIFSILRRDDPIHFMPSEDFPAFWHITKHRDIFEIERRTDIFLSEPRVVLASLKREAALRRQNNGSLILIRALTTMDGPEHQKMRLLTQSWFMPKNLNKLQNRIDVSAAITLDKMAGAAGTCDFARDIAVEFPLRVIMDVLGVPAKDFPTILRLTQELFGAEDPDTKRRDTGDAEGPTEARMRTFQEFSDYFNAMTDDRRLTPKGDVATIIANAEIDGKPIGNAAELGYYIIIATAGHDTTSYSLTEAVRQLALNPDLFERLRTEPDRMAPLIVEEAIRYAAPVRHFIRTASQDYEIGGKTIRQGESVILWYPSGSRDEDVFDNPHTFLPERSTKTRHAAFGHGAHMCLGMHLARQENATFLKALARRVNRIELTGEPRHNQATFVGGIKSMPIEFAMN